MSPQGQQSEWALTKRHESEDKFGIQICGNRPELMIKCAELLSNELEIDFVDINVSWVEFVKNFNSEIRTGSMLNGDLSRSLLIY